jgi:hypothetical protein
MPFSASAMKKLVFLIIILAFLIDLGDGHIGYHIDVGGGESITIVHADHFAKVAPTKKISTYPFEKRIQSSGPVPHFGGQVPPLGSFKPLREYCGILSRASGGLPSK